MTPGLVRYRRIVARQRDATSRAMVAAWDALPGYDEADLIRYAARVQPLLEGAKGATVASATAFYAHVLGVTPPSVPAARVPTVAPVRDPFTAMWHALSESRPYEEAIVVGRSTAEATGSSFIQSTARLTGDAFTAAADLSVRWQRVAEPKACDWCAKRDGNVHLSSSDGDYGHDRCGCDVVPLSV